MIYLLLKLHILLLITLGSYSFAKTSYPIYGIEIKDSVTINGKYTHLLDSQKNSVKVKLYREAKVGEVVHEIINVHQMHCSYSSNNFNHDQRFSYFGIPAYERDRDFYKVNYNGEELWLKLDNYLEAVPLYDRLSKRFHLDNLNKFKSGHFYYEKRKPIEDISTVFKKNNRPGSWKDEDGATWDTDNEIEFEVKSVEKTKDNIWFELGEVKKQYALKYINNNQKIFFRLYNDEGKSEVFLGGCQ